MFSFPIIILHFQKKYGGGGSSFIINSLNSKLIKENCFEKKRWESGLATGLPDVIRPCFIFWSIQIYMSLNKV